MLRRRQSRQERLRCQRSRLRRTLSIHGVGLGLGGVAALDRAHLDRLAALVRRIQPEIVSEHLCWGSWQGRHFNDLLPLPFTEESLALMSARVGERRLLELEVTREVLDQHLPTECVLQLADARAHQGERFLGERQRQQIIEV
ncbi:MAG: DUF692 family protein, partial [Gammaproteobacteria bacterium]|nr:DUF692 family protein [Gammaproteobacteria bacterium]